MMGMESILYTASVWIIPVLLAVALHEAAHGWSAWKLGDDTAYRMGRVTFNPLRHVDPFGTVLLPAMLLYFSGGRVMFGFAKPVPVDFSRLRRPRRDMVLVAAAGPGTNLVLAILSAFAFHLLVYVPAETAVWFRDNLLNSLWINLLLCVFNLLPIPPLDGGRIAVGLLPDPWSGRLARLERAGLAIILGAVFVLPWLGGMMGVDLNVFWWLVGAPAIYLRDLIAAMAGLI